MSHSSREVAHTVPHAHAPEEVVAGVQGGRLGRRVVEVGQIRQRPSGVQGPQKGCEAYALIVVWESAEKEMISVTF